MSLVDRISRVRALAVQLVGECDDLSRELGQHHSVPMKAAP